METPPDYRSNVVHRSNAPGKSQWTVPLAAEEASFKRAWAEGWLMDECGWGLHVVAGKPKWLGTAQDHETCVFIAKYVGRLDSDWHGYPADHARNPQDIPHEDVLGSWLDDEILSAAKVRKVMRGQRCSL